MSSTASTDQRSSLDTRNNSNDSNAFLPIPEDSYGYPLIRVTTPNQVNRMIGSADCLANYQGEEEKRQMIDDIEVIVQRTKRPGADWNMLIGGGGMKSRRMSAKPGTLSLSESTGPRRRVGEWERVEAGTMPAFVR
jgi:hypothetical protein